MSDTDASYKTWFEEVEDRFGLKIYEDKARRWEKILNAPAASADEGFEANARNSELRSAVIWASNRRDYTMPKPFTVGDLFSLLKYYRRELAVERRYGARRATDGHGYLNAIFAKMIAAENHYDRWEILCDPMRVCGFERDPTTKEHIALEAMAKRRWPEGSATPWKRPDLDWSLVREWAAKASINMYQRESAVDRQ